MNKYDGTWENDPLDLRCIRLDAKMEELYQSGKEKQVTFRFPFSPKNLEEVYQLKEEDDDNWDTYLSRTIPKGYLNKHRNPCIILDAANNVVDEDCINEDWAMKRVIDLAIYNDRKIKDYHIFQLRSMSFYELEEVEE